MEYKGKYDVFDVSQIGIYPVSERSDKVKLSNLVNPDISVRATCYEKNILFTIHAGIGTDVLDQHYWFDGEPKKIRESLFHCFTGRLRNSYN